MVVLHNRQNSCSSGYSSWTCLESSTQKPFNGCCKTDPCQNGGICPDTNQDCDVNAGYQPWVCQKTLSQTAYTGCCKIDACANGGSCPASAQPPVAILSSSGKTTTSNTQPASPASTSASAPTPTSAPTSASTTSTISGSSSTTDGNIATLPTTTDLSSTYTPSSSHSNIAIIGGAVGGIVVLLLLVIAVFFFVCRKRSKEQREYDTIGILSMFGRNDNNRNSLADPPTPRQGFFTPFKRRPASSVFHSRDPKASPSPGPQGPVEMPTNSPYPFNRAELDSTTVPSELSGSTPLQDYRNSGMTTWSSTPEPRYTGDTRYSYASSPDSITESSLSRMSGGQPPLRGGVFPTTRSNLHSVRRPVPNQWRHQTQGQSSAGREETGPSASGSGGYEL